MIIGMGTDGRLPPEWGISGLHLPDLFGGIGATAVARSTSFLTACAMRWAATNVGNRIFIFTVMVTVSYPVKNTY